jgi:hypothetical protein
MVYLHYFESECRRVVSHKPVDLEVEVMRPSGATFDAIEAGDLPPTRRTFNLAIKTSEERIKRRLNKTVIVGEVYVTSVEDPAYARHVTEQAKRQAVVRKHATAGREY